jgi:hypothetical protein
VEHAEEVRGGAALGDHDTQTSPNVFFVPAGSSELSEPAKRRPSASHARTGSPDEAVLIPARAAYGDVSPG